MGSLPPVFQRIGIGPLSDWIPICIIAIMLLLGAAGYFHFCWFSTGLDTRDEVLQETWVIRSSIVHCIEFNLYCWWHTGPKRRTHLADWRTFVGFYLNFVESVHYYYPYWLNGVWGRHLLIVDWMYQIKGNLSDSMSKAHTRVLGRIPSWQPRFVNWFKTSRPSQMESCLSERPLTERLFKRRLKGQETWLNRLTPMRRCAPKRYTAYSGIGMSTM